MPASTSPAKGRTTSTSQPATKLISARNALLASGGLYTLFSLLFLFSPYGAITNYELYTPAVVAKGKPPAEPTVKEWASVLYFTVLLALALGSLGTTVIATARVGHANSMKLGCVAGVIGRAGLVSLLVPHLNAPLKKQLFLSIGLGIFQALGATTGGMPTIPKPSVPKSASGKAVLLISGLGLLQMIHIYLSGPVAYMSKMGIDIKHAELATTFDLVAKMWCVTVGMGQISRLSVVLAGEDETIYAVNRGLTVYCNSLLVAFASFGAFMKGASTDSNMGANIQFVVIAVYALISYGALIKDDENAKPKKK